jgi:hypothetical protein
VRGVVSEYPTARDWSRRISTTCPTGGCDHALFWHDVDEIPWPRIERCTVADCRCSGLVESRAAA